MEEARSVYKFIKGKSTRNNPFGRPTLAIGGIKVVEWNINKLISMRRIG